MTKPSFIAVMLTKKRDLYKSDKDFLRVRSSHQSTICHISVVIQFFKAGNTFEAEASRGTARHPRNAMPRTEECFQFLRGAAHSIHTAHKEGNSSGLPHFDLPRTNGSDCGNL